MHFTMWKTLKPVGILAYMAQILSPIASEFATAEEAEAYDRWLCAKVQASLDDSRPNIPHDQVMAEMDAIIERAECKQSSQRE